MRLERPVSTGDDAALVAVAEARVHGQYASVIDERRRLLEELFDICREAHNSFVLGPYQPISFDLAPAARFEKARPGVL
jgi:hypothetical protein